jgi:hypothetical protein
MSQTPNRHCERSVAIFDLHVVNFSIEDCFVPRNDARGLAVGIINKSRAHLLFNHDNTCKRPR